MVLFKASVHYNPHTAIIDQNIDSATNVINVEDQFVTSNINASTSSRTSTHTGSSVYKNGLPSSDNTSSSDETEDSNNGIDNSDSNISYSS